MNRTLNLSISPNDITTTEAIQNCAKSIQYKPLPETAVIPSEQEPALSAHNHNTSLHEICVKYVSKFPGAFPKDLVQVIAAWDSLSASTREAIVALAEKIRSS